MNIDYRLFTCPLEGDGKSWTEVLNTRSDQGGFADLVFPGI